MDPKEESRTTAAQGLIIRNARLDELDEAARLMVEAYEQYAKNIPPEHWKAYRDDIMDVRGRLDGAELIVAELKGRLVGAVTLYLDPSKAETSWPKEWAGIRLLAVPPRYRGKGIGKALMDECVRRARERGYKAIGLHTTDMMDVARGMYERMGFVRVPEFDFRPSPDHLVMAYRLDL